MGEHQRRKTNARVLQWCGSSSVPFIPHGRCLEAHPNVIVIKFRNVVRIVQLVTGVANTVGFTNGTCITKVFQNDDGSAIINEFNNCIDFGRRITIFGRDCDETILIKLRERERISFNTSDNERCISWIFNVGKEEGLLTNDLVSIPMALMSRETQTYRPNHHRRQRVGGLTNVDEVLENGEKRMPSTAQNANWSPIRLRFCYVRPPSFHHLPSTPFIQTRFHIGLEGCPTLMQKCSSDFEHNNMPK